MSCTREVHFFLTLIPPKEDTAHEHILFDSRLDNFICQGKDLCSTDRHLRYSRDKRVDHHHDKSTRDSVSRRITDIEIVITIHPLDDITAISSYFCRTLDRISDSK